MVTAHRSSLQKLCFHRCLSVHGGCLPHCMLRYTPLEQNPPLGRDPPGTRLPPGADTPPAQCMLGDTGNKQAVRILLECILVKGYGLFTCNVTVIVSKSSPKFNRNFDGQNGLHTNFSHQSVRLKDQRYRSQKRRCWWYVYTRLKSKYPPP